VPVHALVPHSRLVAAAAALDHVLQPATRALAQLEFAWHWVAMLVGPGAVLMEPNLSWRQAADPAAPPAPQIVELRAALAQALDAVGGVHLQVGRYYSYASRLQPPARELLQSIKRQLDPAGISNPGALGLG
jgi:FAD/FMN-containing dehydrogenase